MSPVRIIILLNLFILCAGCPNFCYCKDPLNVYCRHKWIKAAEVKQMPHVLSYDLRDCLISSADLITLFYRPMTWHIDVSRVRCDYIRPALLHFYSAINGTTVQEEMGVQLFHWC